MENTQESITVYSGDQSPSISVIHSGKKPQQVQAKIDVSKMSPGISKKGFGSKQSSKYNMMTPDTEKMAVLS